jgi:hypothetical protein
MRRSRWLPLAAALLLAGPLAAAPARAQFAEGGARVLALGRAGVALGAEPWGHTNPAAPAALDGRRAALQASQAFELEALRLATLAAAAPTPVGVVGLGARTYGFDEHRETRVVVGFARALPLSATRSLDVGLAVGYQAAVTEGYEAVGTPLLSVGVQADLVPGLRAGLAGRNLLALGRTGLDDLQHTASTVPGVAVGVAYRPSERALLLLDADQDLDFGLSVRAGAEVVPVEALALRVGVSSGQATWYSAGVGLRLDRLRVDISAERHEALDWTPAAGVDVAF